MSDNNNMQQEEVDLGNLFKAISKGFGNFFKFIGNFFKATLHYIILTLIFLRRNIIVIGLSTLIGAVLGFSLNSHKGSIYQSEMIVDTNFGSAKVLYPKIDLINNLIKIKDTVELATIFNISNSEANSLEDFSIKPYNKDEQLLNDYDKYIKSTDTIYTKEFTIEKYLKRKQDVDLYNHIIIATSKDITVFPKLTSGIKSLAENDHYKIMLAEKQKGFILTEQEIKKDFKNLDTLRKRYNDVARLEAVKNNNTASLNLSTSSTINNTENYDLSVLNLNSVLVNKLNNLNSQKIKYNTIVKVVLSYQVGTKVNKLTKKPFFVFGFLGFFLSILVILGIRLNKYLSNYQTVKI